MRLEVHIFKYGYWKLVYEKECVNIIPRKKETIYIPEYRTFVKIKDIKYDYEDMIVKIYVEEK